MPGADRLDVLLLSSAMDRALTYTVADLALDEGLALRCDGVVQVRVTPKTRNPSAIKALSLSGVTWK
jgi:hypothetical protein